MMGRIASYQWIINDFGYCFSCVRPMEELLLVCNFQQNEAEGSHDRLPDH